MYTAIMDLFGPQNNSKDGVWIPKSIMVVSACGIMGLGNLR